MPYAITAWKWIRHCCNICHHWVGSISICQVTIYGAPAPRLALENSNHYAPLLSVLYFPFSETTPTYDQNDNLTKMQDTLGASTYTYDAVNRLASATDPRGFGIAYTRDANGNVTKVTYPGNKTVSYTYDAVNRLKTVSIDWLAKTAAYVYDDAGRM